jgi:hypothetical protein
MTKYAVGTNVRDIREFDRSIKVIFHCTEHPEFHYMSKQPSCSQWFPANEASRELQWGKEDPCPHTAKDDVWVTVHEYES